VRPNRVALIAVLSAALPLVAVDSAQSTVTVVDDAGATVTLDRPATRVISLAPHITEQLFAIGAGDRIVGTTEHADYPPAAASIPRVGRAHSLDLERIAALHADLIIIWGSGFPPATIASVERLRVPVFISEPHTLADVARSLERLGVLTGRDGAPAGAQFSAKVEALRRQYAARPPVRVFYQVWASPLMTLSGRHVISEAIQLCGGRNVFEGLAPVAPQVSVEAVLAADPQLIVTAEPGGTASPALATWQRFPTLTATRHRQFVTLDADRINRHGPRLADEIAVLCAAIERTRTATIK
jgi:iron complex transport system substrate-binding protein